MLAANFVKENLTTSCGIRVLKPMCTYNFEIIFLLLLVARTRRLQFTGIRRTPRQPEKIKKYVDK